MNIKHHSLYVTEKKEESYMKRNYMKRNYNGITQMTNEKYLKQADGDSVPGVTQSCTRA